MTETELKKHVQVLEERNKELEGALRDMFYLYTYPDAYVGDQIKNVTKLLGIKNI